MLSKASRNSSIQNILYSSSRESEKTSEEILVKTMETKRLHQTIKKITEEADDMREKINMAADDAKTRSNLIAYLFD